MSSSSNSRPSRTSGVSLTVRELPSDRITVLTYEPSRASPNTKFCFISSMNTANFFTCDLREGKSKGVRVLYASNKNTSARGTTRWQRGGEAYGKGREG